jgi:two-component system chemotaxis sensor kinase CheA
MDEMLIEFSSDLKEMLSEIKDVLMRVDDIVCTDKTANAEDLNEMFRNLHTIKGTCSFFEMNITRNLAHKMEDLLDLFRQGKGNLNKQHAQLMFDGVDCLNRIAKGICDNIPETDYEKEATEIKDKILFCIDEIESPEHLKSKNEAPSSNESVSDQIILKNPQEILPLPDQSDTKTDQSAYRSPSLQSNSINQKFVIEARDKLDISDPIPPKNNELAQDAFVQIPVNKLDLMMDLLGEVILVASMVTHHPDIQGLELEDFENTSHQLDLLLRQLQDAAMSLRLIPISNVFQRMKRLIHDFMQETHKQINIVLSGEETEVDKSVAEMLNDPLVHLIRNAADHGLEPADVRVAAGKSEKGTIHLSAEQAGGELRILVEDDGYGLNREKILAKAQDCGLCDLDEEPDDRTAYIFHPGFSTAKEITNISGRGVGMDVVMNNIKNIRGKVTIDSKPGAGTCVTLHIPLTLAILDGMVIKISDILYVLPIETVVEIFQIQKDQINHSSVDNQFVIRIREELVPVVFLNQLYNNEIDPKKQFDSQVMLVIETDGVQLAMPVDELVGQQQVVIKPLVGHLKNIRAVSGCALLESGNVAMVLDVGQLLQLHEESLGLLN